MGRSIEQLFEQFLIDNNCYSQFIINLLEQTNKSFEEFVSNLLVSDPFFEPEEELIKWAFTWAKTEQGYNFWNLLDSKWRILV